MLDIKHLTTLKVIEQTHSLAESAKILNLTLSAVSHQIKQLENYYQCTLFIRKTKPIQFTQQGNMLLKLAEKTLPAFRSVEHALKQQSDIIPSSLNIALECHSCYKWILPTLSDIRQHWPDVDIDLSTEFNFNPLPKLLSGDLNLVITSDPIHHMDIEYTPLFDFQMMAGISSKHPLAKKKYLLPQDLAQETIIAYPVKECKISIIKEFMQPVGVPVHKIRHTELTMMAIELAAIGQGICCLPNWAFAEHQDNQAVTQVALGEKGLTLTLYIACRYEDKDTSLLQDCTRLAQINSLKHLTGIELHEE